MCHEAGITGRKTNHGLRATGASELFAAGVPEKIIKERTGHRFLDALHVYEHSTSTQHQAVSTILGSRNKITFQEAMFAPSTPCSSNSTPANNIFNNCSVQVIQTTQPIQLPPLPPPPSLPLQTQPSPPQHAPGASSDLCTTKTDMDIQQFLDLNLEELLNF